MSNKLALVTVLYNSETVLEEFYESLAKQTFKDYMLFVIENASNDNSYNYSIKLAEKFNIKAIHILNKDNVGIAKGNNQGIEKSLEMDFEYTVLLNNDIVFDDEKMFEDMYNKMVQGNLNLLVPKIYFHGTDKIWMAGGELSCFTGKIKHYGEYQIDSDKFNIEKEVDYSPTCFMIIKNCIFKEVGMMDESYFVYYDDTDFIYRCYKKGYKILYAPKFSFYHKVSISTGGAESKFSVYYYNRNRLLFIRKNFTFPYKQIALTETIITRIIKYTLKKRIPELIKLLKDGLK